MSRTTVCSETKIYDFFKSLKEKTGDKRSLIVMVGTSAAGKSTVIKGIMQMPEFQGKFSFSVSHTTRKPRVGEVDGVHYHYITKEKFLDLIEEDAFLETAINHGNYYGTSFKAISDVLTNGTHGVIDTDFKGMLNIKRTIPNFIPIMYILIMPPSIEVMEKRLRARMTEDEAQIQARLLTAKEELEFFSKNRSDFDTIIINDKLDEAVAELAKSIRCFFKENSIN